MHESASSTISIQLESNNDRMLLEVSCDDKKLGLKKLTANPRMHNLTNRCALFDGDLHFEKAKNEGVLIKASIPV
jgi:signal transduction histidine kinase